MLMFYRRNKSGSYKSGGRGTARAQIMNKTQILVRKTGRGGSLIMSISSKQSLLCSFITDRMGIIVYMIYGTCKNKRPKARNKPPFYVQTNPILPYFCSTTINTPTCKRKGSTSGSEASRTTRVSCTACRLAGWPVTRSIKRAR